MFAYQTEAGELHIVVPTGNPELARKDIPPGVEYVEVASVPQSRRWRNAWKLAGGTVQIDLTKAKKVRLNELADEAKQYRKQAIEAMIDGDKTRQDELTSKVQKILKVRITDLPDDLQTLENWRP